MGLMGANRPWNSACPLSRELRAEQGVAPLEGAPERPQGPLEHLLARSRLGLVATGPGLRYAPAIRAVEKRAQFRHPLRFPRAQQEQAGGRRS